MIYFNQTTYIQWQTARWFLDCLLLSPLKTILQKHYSYYISVSTRIRYSFYCAPRSWSPLFITLSGTSYTMNQTAYQFFIGCADTTFTIERSWTFQQCLHFLVIRGKVNVSKLCIKIILVNSWLSQIPLRLSLSKLQCNVTVYIRSVSHNKFCLIRWRETFNTYISIFDICFSFQIYS